MVRNKVKVTKKYQGVLGISPIYLLIATLVCGSICLIALRHNNQHMEQLKQAVYSADKNNDNVQQALDNLQAYVTSNMNTNLSTGNGSVYPPIQLEYTYLRLVKAQDQAALSNDAGLYTAAQNYCQNLDPTDFSGRNRVPCIAQYVTSHGAKLPKIPAALYEFDFVSPTWSPDLAGWTLMLTILLAILTAVLFLARYFNRHFSPKS